VHKPSAAALEQAPRVEAVMVAQLARAAMLSVAMQGPSSAPPAAILFAAKNIQSLAAAAAQFVHSMWVLAPAREELHRGLCDQ
jgi:hypothetical protein